ncbi:MAG: hypothetical protein ACRCZO_04405 [Cetobacterium sp.]|uniref:hypothetical protein n=1 Tax=Cetobacterium sp. TaxID=2071632 RepID=UPI003EE5C739
MDENKERLKNELILEQLEEIERLIDEHEQNSKYVKENILEAILKYSKCKNIEEMVERNEFEDLISLYKESES